MKARALLATLGTCLLLIAAVGFAPLRDHDLALYVTAADAQTAISAGQAVAAPGMVEPYSEERDLAATSTGAIIFIGGEEGDTVRAGQVIAEIDNADLKAQLTGARARISIRESELQRLMNGARDEERGAATASVAEAMATLRLTTASMDRHRYLAVQGVSSPQALDQARADLEGAKARYELMTQRLALLTAPPRPEDVAIARANLELAKADASALEAQIDKTRLRSPVDGVLLRRYKALGETVSENPPTLVAKIGDLSRLRVRAEIDERDVARVSRGQRVFITADAYGDRRFTGRVTKVGVWLGHKRVWTEASTEKTDTKTLDVIIEPDAAIELPPGLRVDVMFEPPAPVAAHETNPAG